MLGRKRARRQPRGLSSWTLVRRYSERRSPRKEWSNQTSYSKVGSEKLGLVRVTFSIWCRGESVSFRTLSTLSFLSAAWVVFPAFFVIPLEALEGGALDFFLAGDIFEFFYLLFWILVTLFLPATDLQVNSDFRQQRPASKAKKSIRRASWFLVSISKSSDSERNIEAVHLQMGPRGIKCKFVWAVPSLYQE